MDPMIETDPNSTPPPRRPGRPSGSAPNLDIILPIPVTVQVVLGTTTMPVARLMKSAAARS